MKCGICGVAMYVYLQVGDVRVFYTYAGRTDEGREDVVSQRALVPMFLYHIPILPHHTPILSYHIPILSYHIPMLSYSQVSVVGRQSPGPVITHYTTSDGYRVLFLYMDRLSMDVSHTV